MGELLYVDDIAVVTEWVETASTVVRVIEMNVVHYGLRLNISKCEVVVMGEERGDGMRRETWARSGVGGRREDLAEIELVLEIGSERSQVAAANDGTYDIAGRPVSVGRLAADLQDAAPVCEQGQPECPSH